MTTHILVVDDHASVRTTLQAVLEDAGYAVTTAADGRAALQSILTACPDLVLTDLHLPVMDGRELLAALRVRALEVPVVLMSLDADVRMVAQLLQAAGALPKPFELDHLLDLVARYVAGPARDD